MGEWTTIAVALHAQQHKITFHNVLDLEPVLRWSAAIAAGGSLRHDAFNTMLHCGGKEGLAITFEMLAVADRQTRLDDTRELGATLDQRACSQVFAIQVDQIEGIEHKPLRLKPDC
jgi:hypothetical protein